MAQYILDLLILAAVTSAVFGGAFFLESDRRLQRLKAAAPATALRQNPSLRRGGSFFERFIAEKFKDRFLPTNETRRGAVKTQLMRAGYDSPRAVQAYYTLRVLLAGSFLGMALLLAPMLLSSHNALGTFVVPLAGAYAGFLSPSIILDRQTARRQRQVGTGLPDILDLLLVCTEAGLGIDMAIDKVGEETDRSHPLIAKELRLIGSELRAGRSRAEAMRGFAERTGVEEVTALVTLMVQSDSLGTSMAATLRIFAADMRAHRMLKAEQMAQKISVKLSLVLITTLLPAILVVILAPAAVNIVRVLGSMSK